MESAAAAEIANRRKGPPREIGSCRRGTSGEGPVRRCAPSLRGRGFVALPLTSGETIPRRPARREAALWHGSSARWGPSWQHRAGGRGDGCARRSPYAVATLSRAAGGEQLPTLPVVPAYVNACGGNAAEREARRRLVSEELTTARARERAEEPSPYRGPARFEPGDHALFFGRDRLVDDLAVLATGHRAPGTGASRCSATPAAASRPYCARGSFPGCAMPGPAGCRPRARSASSRRGNIRSAPTAPPSSPPTPRATCAPAAAPGRLQRSPPRRLHPVRRPGGCGRGWTANRRRAPPVLRGRAANPIRAGLVSSTGSNGRRGPATPSPVCPGHRTSVYSCGWYVRPSRALRLRKGAVASPVPW